MGFFKRKRELSPIDALAEKAYKRGDTVYVRKLFAMPANAEKHLAASIMRIEAAGWKLENQHVDGVGLRRSWTCTFRAVPDVAASA